LEETVSDTELASNAGGVARSEHKATLEVTLCFGVFFSRM